MVICSACSGPAKEQAIIVRCKDGDGNPVPGVSVQLCTDATCMQSLSDYKGSAKFEVEPGEYDIRVQSVPEGMEIVEDSGIRTSKDAGEYEFVFAKAADQKKKFQDFGFLDGLDLTGAKVIMVNYWEPWCGHCVEEMPALEKLYQDYKDRGLMIVGLHKETKNADEVIASTGVTYPIINIPYSSIYTKVGVPATVFITPEGEILAPEEGAYSDGNGYLGKKPYEEWETIIKNKLEQ